MVYQWKYGVTGVSAQDAGKYFELLEARDGEIKPSAIVNEARPEDALMHPAFEWDDNAAAEKYREYQAQHIIRNIVVIQERDENQEPLVTRAIVNVSLKDDKRGKPSEKARYVSISTAISDADMKEILLKNAFSELAAFKSKYQGISEFANLFFEIEKLAS